MEKKIKIIIALMLVVFFTAYESSSYAKYLIGSDSGISGSIAMWQISVNEKDLGKNEGKEISFVPVLLPDDNIASGAFAPGRKGYFDIEIDPSNVGVSFKYDIFVNVDNASTGNIQTTNVVIPEYVILPSEDKQTIKNGTINGCRKFVATTNPFEKITYRLYFEWPVENSVTLNALDSNKFVMRANIKFTQLSEKEKEDCPA